MTDLSSNGNTIHLEPGQELVVKLDANTTTGFKWQMVRVPDEQILLPNGEKFYQTDRQKQYQSNISSQYMRFVAQEPGTTPLRLDYVQPSVGRISNSRMWEVDIVVSDSTSQLQQDTGSK